MKHQIDMNAFGSGNLSSIHLAFRHLIHDADIFHVPLTYIQPDQSLFIERAAATYGKKGKIEALHLAFELTELFASGELTAQDMDGIMYQICLLYTSRCV